MKAFIVLFINLILVLGVMAQKPKDAQVWSEIGFNIKLSKNIKLNLSEEIRLENNASQIGNIPTSAGLTFKIGKVYRIKPTVRLNLKNGINSFRYTVDQTLKFNLPNKLWWSNRLRLQYNHDYEIPYVNFKYRFKSTVTKKLGKDVKLNIGGELFYKDYYNFSNFNNYRIQSGLDFDLGKEENATLGVFYIFENEIYEAAPQINHIYGLSLSFDLF